LAHRVLLPSICGSRACPSGQGRVTRARVACITDQAASRDGAAIDGDPVLRQHAGAAIEEE